LLIKQIIFFLIINESKSRTKKWIWSWECKHLVIESAKDFINKKIYEEYNGNIGEGILKKKLLQLNQKQKKIRPLNLIKNSLTKH